MSKTEHEHFIESYPRYKVDINNPQNSDGGPDVVTHYAWTDDDSKASIGYDENGKLKILAEKDLEIVAGAKKPKGGVDILIHSEKGNVEIHADENGEIRITAKNILIKSDESMKIQGGKKITMEAHDIEFKGNCIRGNQWYGNMAPYVKRFTKSVFSGPLIRVAADQIEELSKTLDKASSWTKGGF